ncbi:Glycosyl transferase family 2 [Fibrobacter sp. UWT3]|uniref:glycosyltransferase family 2 protein n=1 Tax=Fibrobacter sp. UWT3 TaxID=1896225 RepID=UPI000BCDD020|nr:glycosyltransferase family 2 protein [Fibrobacter sp. UWT3]SOE56906.1 Glycosyl transferase family 2 [Fibrobacter sp. UWT3]
MCHPERSKAKSKDLDYFIFVPAYSVSRTLADVLGRISPAVMERAQVLVIDDGSKDDTHGAFESFVAGLAGGAGHLQYIRFEFNRGYGAVVKCGISEGLRSGAKYIACLHGDGQYPAEQLGEFFAHLEGVGSSPVRNQPALALVQGSRHAIPGAARAGNMPLHKRIGGAFLTALENIAFRQKLTDRHSGFIVYNASFLKTLDLAKLSPSFDIDLEIISIADARGWRLAELPIPTRYAGEKSNLNVVTYGLRVLRQILRRMCLRKR